MQKQITKQSCLYDLGESKASGPTVGQGIASLFLELCSSNPSQQAALSLWHLATVSGSVQSVLPAPEK